MQTVLWLHGWLSRKAAAAYLGVSPGTLAVWARTGRCKLPFVKIGGLAHYRRDDLDAFVARRVKAPRPDLRTETWS